MKSSNLTSWTFQAAYLVAIISLSYFVIFKQSHIAGLSILLVAIILSASMFLSSIFCDTASFRQQPGISLSLLLLCRLIRMGVLLGTLIALGYVAVAIMLCISLSMMQVRECSANERADTLY